MAEIAECPICATQVPADAAECPKCGEIFEQQVLELESLKGLNPETEEGTGLRGKLLFYTGVVLVLVGGPGIALGSWLHDLMRIPIVGNAYEVFGSLNRFVAAIGLVVLVVGIVLLILALRLSRPHGDEYDIGARSEEEPAR